MIRMPASKLKLRSRPKYKRQHRQRDALRREGLGRGDADFRPGVQVDAAVGLLGDRAAHDVADRQRRMPLALHLAQGRQRVGRFAALRDGEQQRVVVERRIAIAQLAGVFDFDRNPGQFLDQIFADQRRVPTGAAGGEQNAVDARAAAAASDSSRRTRPWLRPGSSRPRMAFRIVSGCSKISLSM